MDVSDERLAKKLLLREGILKPIILGARDVRLGRGTPMFILTFKITEKSEETERCFIFRDGTWRDIEVD